MQDTIEWKLHKHINPSITFIFIQDSRLYKNYMVIKVPANDKHLSYSIRVRNDILCPRTSPILIYINS